MIDHVNGELKLHSGWIPKEKVHSFKEKCELVASALFKDKKDFKYQIKYYDLDGDDFGTEEKPCIMEKWMAEITFYSGEKHPVDIERLISKKNVGESDEELD
ncbi:MULTISPECIES: hypothetical protein [Bacillus cereus group]|uniref:Uncharacterized protein n=2 Tax=Bacillus cereus TaxID=1396 RepID=A0A9X6ZE46_BACCE|nr:MULTISPECIES: hypothetical protein [Bacillus cereus group]PFA29431.1 hypothetical protein CN384_06935 [Bacillus thuringiensis]PFF46135.1 hypothetical protein CN357_22080 [Bacillus cereus]PFQ30196.1 hypothetical protein COK33_28495 [Bacillus cereus]PGB15591.1 hypothetical protein COM09_08215 [Bacillus toyonensis]PGW10674.1 hypothetical protein COD97_17455 [Bacillus cereus]